MKIINLTDSYLVSLYMKNYSHNLPRPRFGIIAAVAIRRAHVPIALGLTPVRSQSALPRIYLTVIVSIVAEVTVIQIVVGVGVVLLCFNPTRKLSNLKVKSSVLKSYSFFTSAVGGKETAWPVLNCPFSGLYSSKSFNVKSK